MTRLYIHHLHELGYCNNGAREIAKMYNWDWYDFLQNGIDVSILIASDDAYAVQAANYVIKKETDNGNEEKESSDRLSL